jgi:hypothetical protein
VAVEAYDPVFTDSPQGQTILRLARNAKKYFPGDTHNQIVVEASDLNNNMSLSEPSVFDKSLQTTLWEKIDWRHGWTKMIAIIHDVFGSWKLEEYLSIELISSELGKGDGIVVTAVKLVFKTPLVAADDGLTTLQVEELSL